MVIKQDPINFIDPGNFSTATFLYSLIPSLTDQEREFFSQQDNLEVNELNVGTLTTDTKHNKKNINSTNFGSKTGCSEKRL